MAKLAIGPAGREAVKIEIGGGNGEQRQGNGPGNNTPVRAGQDGGPPGRNKTAQNEDAQAEFGNERVGNRGNGRNERVGNNGNGDEDRGRSRGRGNADDGDGDLWAGWGNGRDHSGKGKGHTRTDSHSSNWPVLTFPRHPSHEDDDPEVNRRRDDDRDRNHRETYNANQASLRRGVIRDYLRQNLQDTLLEYRQATNSPIDLQRLTQTVADRLLRTYNDPAILTNKTLDLITKELSHLLGKDFHFNPGNPAGIPYEKASQIATLLVQHISSDVDRRFAEVNPKKMLDAFVLLQLCCNPGKYIKEMREITGHKPCILPDGIPWSAFRDTGLLAATLMREGASLRTAASLDAAVQRFVKMLVANNELGILLAAIRLTADARAGIVPNSSIVALVRIYELIAQLMILTDRAMKEASEAAARKPAELMRTDRGLAFENALETNEAESALRQYLAFNPAAQADSGAAAFFSEELAEKSARIAVDSSQREIVEWLGSGRHRFVTEVDLGKAVGIVIDRATDVCFTASQIRVVLVRDASVLGWHILRSCLVA